MGQVSAWFAEPGTPGLLFQQPLGVLRADTAADLRPLLDEVACQTAAGRWAAGGLAYEAGLLLEPRLAALAPARLAGPWGWFGLFEAPRAAPPPPGRGHGRAGPARPVEPARAHAARVAALLALIAAGELYQANLATRAEVELAGDPAAAFARLLAHAPAPHGAFVDTGRGWWLSLSPERFFRLGAGRLEVEPMKGTAPRHPEPARDRARAAALAADPKNRAENLMIVDLMRHDLARVSRPGSVQVEAMFAPVTLPHVHQLVSRIAAQVAAGVGAVDVLRALFPCGSVTGAPKIRAMQAIAALEPRPRGLFCGALGWIAPGGHKADFRVAIRTLELPAGARLAGLGLGSGVVADSVALEEWRECLAKARFLEPQRPAALFETMRLEADGRAPLLEQHLARLGRSAERFGFPLDAGRAAALAAPAPPGTPRRARLRLGASGALALAHDPLPHGGAPVRLAVVRRAAHADDWRLHHKTSDRRPYGEALARARAAGADDALLVDAARRATETAIANLFVAEGAMLLTPPLGLGLLAGVLRERLLAQGRAREAGLTLDDVRQASRRGRLFVGNALRGLRPARLVEDAPACLSEGGPSERPAPPMKLSQALSRIAPSATIAVSARARELKAAGRDILALSAGEPDFDTPPHVKDAAIAAIKAGQTKYTNVDGTPELKRAVQAKFRRDNGLDFALDEISVGVGGKHVIFNALMATLDPADEVLIPAPYWVSYPDIVALAGARSVVVPCPAAHGFRITPAQLDAAITPATRWFVLNSPSNPTGAVYPLAELRALAEVLLAHPHVMVLSDDIYEHILYPERPFRTIAEVAPRLADRVLTVNGASKAYAMTGWRIGFAGGPRALIEAMAKLQSQSTTNPCSIAQAAAATALTGPHGFLVDRRRAFRARRDAVVDALNSIPGLHCTRPEGAFYVYPTCEAWLGRATRGGRLLASDEDVAAWLLDEAGVAVVHGGAFGLSPAFRISYATGMDTLMEACRRIGEAALTLS